MKVSLINFPNEDTWLGVRNRALVTVGKHTYNPPDLEWKHAILKARHSPIRHLQFGFYMEDIPSWVATHFARHVHAQPYIKSQRNDKVNRKGDKDYDRNAARQDTPVNMIFDVNAEELMTIANKRLCMQASPETRLVCRMMCDEVLLRFPEFEGLLVPACEYNGVCHEMFHCGKEM